MPALSAVGVYTVIAVLAGVENVFPPVPADTAVALGAFLSQTGTISPWMVFGVTWLSNVSAATAVYIGARTLGRKFFTGRVGQRLLNPRALVLLEDLYRRHGLWGIFVSRFIPGLRAVVPPFAGVVGLGSIRALLPMALASAIWYGTLTFVAATVVGKLDDVGRFVLGLHGAGLVAFGVLVVAVVGWIVWWRRQKRRRTEVTRQEGS